ncbi:MAG: metallophosphoesterase family protein [Chloroflexi bacterium]|nr:metallophosphoesterase family protein [Chloroflexota bacterium]
MRTLIVADVHSNLAAFQAVIDDAVTNGGFDEIWSLGDILGYGPEPSECIELLRSYPHKMVAGNHDLGSVGEVSLRRFNPYAAAANQWTGKQLTREQADYIRALPLTLEIGEFTLAHGSPRDPIWEYLTTAEAAIACFTHVETYWCLVGHSHLPFLCIPRLDSAVFMELPKDRRVQLDDNPLIINPGSVGQPRDRDPRASFAVYDDADNTILHRRVPYDIKTTQEKMRRHNLPDFLIERLAVGH